MKVRPQAARGYIDDLLGGWLRSVLDNVHREEIEIRKKAHDTALALDLEEEVRRVVR